MSDRLLASCASIILLCCSWVTGWGQPDCPAASACNGHSFSRESGTYLTADSLFTLPVKEVQLVFHVFQKSAADPQNFEDIEADRTWLTDMVEHPNFGLNAILSNLCQEDERLRDARLRFRISNMHFWQDEVAWRSSHYWCSTNILNGPYNTDRGCEVFDRYVTNNEALPAGERDALHIFFVEASELSDGRVEVFGGAYAKSIAPADGRNYVMFTGQFNDYAKGGEPQGGSLTHELSLLLGNTHDHGHPDYVMGHARGNQRCALTLEQISRIHYWLDGNCPPRSRRCPTLHKAVLTDN